MRQRLGQLRRAGALIGGLAALCLLLASCLPVSPPTAASANVSAAAHTLPIGTEPLSPAVPIPDQLAARWTTARDITVKATTGLFLHKSTLLRLDARSELTFTPPTDPATLPLPEAELILHNATAEPICYVFIAPADAADWGADRLDGEERIAAGGERLFVVEPGRYDLRADDCAGQMVDDVRAVHVRVQVRWVIRGAGAPIPEPVVTPVTVTATPTTPTATLTPAPTLTPTATPVPLAEFLCCGGSAGGTLYWGIGYPSGWTATTLPLNAQRWLAVTLASPADDIRIVIAPAAWTPMGTPMDVGDVDLYLNAVAQDQAARSRDFKEILRRPIPGAANARYWSATWWEDDRQFYGSYLAVVTGIPYVEQLPRGMLMALGMQAEAGQWRTAVTLYSRMLDTLQIQEVDGPKIEIDPDGQVVQSTEAQAIAAAGKGAAGLWELYFCPIACAWEFVETTVASTGQTWVCSDGCVGLPAARPCGSCE